MRAEDVDVRGDLIRSLGAAVPADTDRYRLVAVDGADGSGKTTFAAELAEELQRRGRPAVVVHADEFLRPSALRYRRGRCSPEGFWLDSYDYPALERDVLVPLGPGGNGRYRSASIDPRRDMPVSPPTRRAAPGTVAVVEGLFLHRDRLVGRWDHSVFLHVPFPETVRRMARRDGTPADLDDPLVRRYVEGQRLYFRACRPWHRATLVVDNRDPPAARVMPAGETALLDAERSWLAR